jgi:aminomethyltransferase
MSAAPLRTSLHDRHTALGARMGAFAGWDMPIEYAGVRAEHRAVREHAGLFDVSHMGQIEVHGAGGRDFLQRVLTNDVSRVGPGQGQYTLLPTADGGVVDDLILYGLLDRFLLVVNAANIAACLDRLREQSPPDVEVLDRSPEVAMLALQGPAWREVIGPLCATPAPLALPYTEITEDQVARVPCLVARTGYTGEPGVELMCPAELAPRLWDALVGGRVAATPCGLAARDTLRLEMGYPLYGNELSRDRSPIEAGLGWACDLGRGGFPGAERMRREAAEGTAERLAMIRLTEPGIPRPGCAVRHEGAPAGTLTSGTLSPTLGVGIGMGYIPRALAAPGTPIAVDIRGKVKAAETARRPLVDTNPRKGDPE